METILRCPHCGHDEFISSGDAVEYYRIVDGKPEFIRSELDGASPHELTCAECGEHAPPQSKEVESTHGT